MINKSIIIIFLFLCITVGCESPNESYINAEQYYPLEIGNKWYYSFDQTDINVFNEVKEIISISVISNKSYYKTVVYGLPPSTYSDTSYFRAERSKLFCGMTTKINGMPTFTEKLVADFSLKIGDTIRVNPYEYITVIEKGDENIKFSDYSEGLYGRTKFQKGIGIIESVVSNAVIHRRVLVKSELK